MPTLRTVTVKPSGGDYTSLSAAEAGEQGDLVTLDRRLDIACYAMNDTTPAAFISWTTDATRYVRVYTPSAERHAGVWNSSKYNLVVVDNDALELGYNCEYIRAEGLQLRTTAPTVNYWAACNIQTFTLSSDMRLSHCILRGSNDATFVHEGVNTGSNPQNVRVFNNIIYDINGAAQGTGINMTQATSWVYNNTIVVNGANGRGLDCSTSGTIVSKNNLIYAPGGSVCFHTSGTLTNTNCSSSDATADDFGGSGNRVTQTFTFVNAGANDYHLAGSDAGAKGFGVDLSADADLPFADDIDGNGRGSVWDIGADQYIAPFVEVKSSRRFAASQRMAS